MRAITTRSTGGSSAWISRKASRTQRLTRFRPTAFATLEDTVIPIRGRPAPASAQDQQLARAEPGAAFLHREELTAAPQARGLGQLHRARYLVGALVVRRLRPLARRRLMTLRPPGVAMRFRKPWVRFRLTSWVGKCASWRGNLHDHVRHVKVPPRRPKPPSFRSPSTLLILALDPSAPAWLVAANTLHGRDTLHAP